MRASFMLKNCWVNTTDQLGDYYGITRPRVMLVLVSLSMYSLVGVDHAVGLSS